MTRLDGSEYQDYGIREVNSRLVKSPAGKWKAIVIEDIERMNDASANAFLKMLEEPLPGRLIIATTSR
jgi:DNA polymerase III gamma/tau subunit